MNKYRITVLKTLATMLFVTLAIGCSNALTESSAVGILQKHIDEQAQANPQLKAEGLVVESCERLVLAAETTATARCKFRTKNKSADVFPEVVFGKKPDGTWVVTSVTRVS